MLPPPTTALQVPQLTYPVPPADTEPESSILNPSQLLNGFKRHLWLPLSLAILGVILGYSYHKRQKPVFEATSVAQFGGEHGSLLGIDGVGSSNFRDEKAINTLIQAAKSREVMGRVVSELKLTQQAGFSGGHPEGSKEARESAVALVSSMIRVSLRKETRLIDFVVSGPDSELVISLSSQAVLSLVAELENQKSKTMQDAVQALVVEGQRLQEKLKVSEIAMHDYKRSNKAISLDERKDLVLTKLKELGSDLNNQSKQRLMLETHLQACKSGDLPTDQLLNLPTIANHPKVSGILAQIGAQKASLAVLAERYKPKHPKYEAANAVIVNLEKQMTSLLADAVGLLQSSCENERELERKLQEQLRKQESEVLDLEQLAVQYNVLKREMESDQAVYESVLTRIKQVDVSKGVETPPIWVHQLATVPTQPASSGVQKAVGTSAAGGFMLGLAIIGLIVIRDNSIRTVDDAHSKLRHPVLCVITNLRKSVLNSEDEDAEASTQMILDAHAAVAESMREFRTIVAKMSKNQKACHMIVSAVPDEGKTFVSTHLAVSLASQGLRTLLIDMDMRRPSLGREFCVPDSCHGVSDLLLGDVSIREACYSTGIDNLAIMPSGRTVSNPAELLTAGGVARLRKMAFELGFDRIVLDTAPLIPVNDTLVLGDLADNVFMVVRCNRTPSDMTLDGIRKLQQSGIPISGLVLNRLTQRKRGHDYYYHNYYHNLKATA